ncbi:MAG: biotin/lipoyl-binding protein, partial [Anaerolineae bacterium]|nr:biotin/lipoyl-binding protein [Anaerolineae bacterium]
MTTEFNLPELGENVAAGDVVNVLVSVGDTIAKDQPVLELETDKATIEVPSSVSGVVKEIHIKAGERANVGQLILTVDSGNGQPEAKAEPKKPAAKEEPEPAPAPEPAAPKAASGPVEFNLPELGENISGGDVVRVMVSAGDTVKQDQPVLELETDKATIEVPSPVGGVVKAVHLKAGERANVGQLILTIDSSEAAPAPAKAEPAPEPEPKPEPKAE